MSQGSKLKRLTSIVAIDRNGAIGAQNSLPWRLKSDLKFFKKTTLGNSVVMGRKTLDSIGNCLPNRKNIILSHTLDLFQSTEECRLVHSLQEAIFEAERQQTEEIFVVGGAMTYLQFAPLVDRYLVTVVDCEVECADAFLDQSILKDLSMWRPSEQERFPATEGQDDYAFAVYEALADDLQKRRKDRQHMLDQYARQIKHAAPRGSRAKRANEFSQPSFI